MNAAIESISATSPDGLWDALPELAKCLEQADASEKPWSVVNQELQGLGDQFGIRVLLAVDHDNDQHGGQYDVIAMNDAGASILLAVCHQPRGPWMLRGAQRWRDADLLLVDGQRLRVVDALNWLEPLWGDRHLADQLIDHLILVGAARQNGAASPEEVEAFSARYRRSLGLAKAADLMQWLEAKGLSYEDFQAQMADFASVASLRRRGRAEVEACFESQRQGFARVLVCEWQLPTSEAAGRLLAELQHADEAGNGGDVLGPAIRAVAGGVENPQVPTVALRFVCDVVSDLGLDPAVLAFTTGAIGPFRMPDGRFKILKPLARHDAILDGDTSRRVEELLVRQWIDQRRETAKIEWNWGPAKGVTG